MKRQLILRLEAEAGIAGAINFYKVQSESTVQKFIEVLDEVFDRILDLPDFMRCVRKRFDGLTCQSFPTPYGLKLSLGPTP